MGPSLLFHWQMLALGVVAEKDSWLTRGALALSLSLDNLVLILMLFLKDTATYTWHEYFVARGGMLVADHSTLIMCYWELFRVLFVFGADICSVFMRLVCLVGRTEGWARLTLHRVVFIELLRDLALWFRKEDVLKLFKWGLFHDVISLGAVQINVFSLAERWYRPLQRTSLITLWGLIYLFDTGARCVLRGAYLHWIHTEGIHLLI